MGTFSRCIDGGNAYFLDYFVAAAVTDAQVMVIEATASNVGEAAQPGDVNTYTDAIGCASGASTFDATPTTEPGREPYQALENVTRIIANPLAIWRFAVSGGTASGTVLQPSTSTPANILTNDTADTTPDTVTETAVGTISMVGGLLKGRTGANKGAIRKITAHSNSASTGVGIDFLNTIAVNDTFIRVPYSRMQREMELTTDFTEANGIETYADQDGLFNIVNVIIDELHDTAWVDGLFRNHYLNEQS